MKNPNNPADGTFVVIENGQRVTAPVISRPEAEAEATRRNKLAESSTGPVPEARKAAVKQNLCG